MSKLHLDFETRSTLDIKKVGAWAYASHPSTDITCMGIAENDLAPVVFRRDQVSKPKDPQFLRHEIIVAHSAQFEYAVYHFILHKRYGWPAILDPKRWDCTMARALMCGIPASLEGAALTLKLKFQKDLDGRRAMYETCKPREDGTWNEDSATLERLYRYNAIDVETERALDHALPELPPTERKIFELDLVMNRRGVGIDIRSAVRAAAIAEEITEKLNKDLRKITGGAVSKASRIAEMKRWIEAQGVAIPTKTVQSTEEDGTITEEEKETLDKEAVVGLIKDSTVPDVVKSAISIRQQVGKSSVSKFKSMLAAACGDGRVRGAIQYHGAHTGRDAGRLIQPQNYPQGLVGSEQEQAIALLEDPAIFADVYGDSAMQTLSDILRGMIVPSAGKIFLSADYNAIEARVVFWLAGEMGALSMYARGESPYLDMGRLIFGREISKKSDLHEYNLAKMTVLGAGFGMGAIKFRAQAAVRGVEISEELAQRAIKTYRGYYRNVVSLWYATEAAAVKAVLNPGQMFTVAAGKAWWGMSKDRNFLVCKLPSGRFLRYFRPTVREEKGRRGEPKSVLYYWGAASESAIKTDAPENKSLGWYKTWGGELVENSVQAIARDIMMAGLVNVEEAGYSIVLRVHDELLAEISDPAYSSVLLGRSDTVVEHFTKLMCKTPAWAAGLPVAAESWIGRRYRK